MVVLRYVSLTVLEFGSSDFNRVFMRRDHHVLQAERCVRELELRDVVSVRDTPRFAQSCASKLLKRYRGLAVGDEALNAFETAIDPAKVDLS